MLEDKRIREAQTCVKEYLREGMLKKISSSDSVVMRILVNNSKESLKVSEILFKDKHSDMWTIVCSYYSMYYMANAVLYKYGYKVGEQISHKVTADALIVYIMDKLKKTLLMDYEDAFAEANDLAGIRSNELVDTFDKERIKRNMIQYNTSEEVKHSKAKTSLDRAKKFIFEMEKQLS